MRCCAWEVLLSEPKGAVVPVAADYLEIGKSGELGFFVFANSPNLSPVISMAFAPGEWRSCKRKSDP